MDQPIPYIDATVKHVPVGYLRKLNVDALRSLNQTLVVDTFDGTQPLVVIVPFEIYLQVQAKANGNAEN